jgi:uncharacterized protein (TIGR03067 family)
LDQTWRGIVVKKHLTIGCVLFLIIPSARSAPPADEAKAVQGTWIPVLLRFATKQKISQKRMESYRITITSDSKYMLRTPEGNEDGTLVLRPDKSPKEIDFTCTAGPSKGRTFLGIYDVIDGQLCICYDPSGKQRPTEFTVRPDSSSLLGVYRRQ